MNSGSGTVVEWTGKGWVKSHTGSYTDALKKGSRVIPAVVEAGTGGISPHFGAQIGHLSRRATAKGARDRTRYGTSRTSTRSYFVHHVQQISLVATTGDARAIMNDIRARKTIALTSIAGARAAGVA